MSTDDQAVRLLSELELNEYETRAYLSVVEGGVMVARDISDRASIPYAKVYQTLNDLIDKQLVTGDEGRPKKFRARPPEEAIQDRLDRLERDWMKEHQIRKTRIKPLIPELQSLYEASDVEAEEEQGVWNISGSTNIGSRLAKLANRSSNQIIVVTGNYNNFKELFLKILKDNADVPLVLVCEEEIDDPVFKKCHQHDNVGKAITLYYDQFAMMSIAEIQKGKYSAGEYTAVVTQISELVKSALLNVEVLMNE